VYTVSAWEYWNGKVLNKEETGDMGVFLSVQVTQGRFARVLSEADPAGATGTAPGFGEVPGNFLSSSSSFSPSFKLVMKNSAEARDGPVSTAWPRTPTTVLPKRQRLEIFWFPQFLRRSVRPMSNP